MFKLPWRLVPLLALLSACGGKPTTYLTLSPANPATTLDGTGPLLAVDPVSIPPDLDRSELTTATGQSTLTVNGSARWAAPLGDLIQSALARDLVLRLPRTRVLMPGDPVPQGGTREVHVTVGTLIADAAGRVTLDADWSITPPNSQTPAAERRFHVALDGGAAPGAEAGTMSAAIGRLADDIAQAAGAAP